MREVVTLSSCAIPQPIRRPAKSAPAGTKTRRRRLSRGTVPVLIGGFLWGGSGIDLDAASKSRTSWLSSMH
jgi:hypothetical protein